MNPIPAQRRKVERARARLEHEERLLANMIDESMSVEGLPDTLVVHDIVVDLCHEGDRTVAQVDGRDLCVATLEDGQWVCCELIGTDLVRLLEQVAGILLSHSCDAISDI